MKTQRMKLLESKLRKLIREEMSDTSMVSFYIIPDVFGLFKIVSTHVMKMGATDCIYDHGTIAVILSDTPKEVRIQELLHKQFGDNIDVIGYNDAIDRGIIDRTWKP